MTTPARREKLKTAIANRQQGIVVLEDIHDPHNGQAVLRSCEAFGFQEVWFVFAHQEGYNPRKVGKTTSSTANKWLNYRRFSSTKDCLQELARNDYTSCATVLSESAKPIDQVSFTTPRIAIWFGNEHSGLSAEALAGIDQHIIIPMRGIVQSLNISVTAGIVLHEVTRQRMQQGMTPFLLSSGDQETLLDDFLQR